MEHVKKKAKRFLVISLVTMLISMVGASLIQTNFGHVEMKEMYWETEVGIGISANLYIPDTASSDDPAPAVVTSHGYLNNKGMQDTNPVELARRGFVVLAVDQPGCGESDIADYLGENGNGLNFCAIYQGALELSRLPFVDVERIGVTGHSMGGMSCNMAVVEDEASGNPVISAVLLNSIDALYTDSMDTIFGIAAIAGGDNYTNMYGARDVGIIACQYDEFFHVTPAEDGTLLEAPYFMSDSVNAQSFLHFGEDPADLERREAGQMYHQDIDGEDAIRVIYNPAQIHPWSHFSARSASAVIEFFTEALGAPNAIESSSQIWQVKEAFNLLGLVGFVMFIVSLATMMLYTRTFEELRAVEIAGPVQTDKKGLIWFAGTTVVSTLLACLTYQLIVEGGKNSGLSRAPMIFGIALWAAFNGVIAIIGMVLSYRMSGKQNGFDLVEHGVVMPVKKLGKTVLLAAVIVAAAYGTVFFAHYFFLTDFRIWNVAVKYVNAEILGISLFPHAILFTVFYIALSVSTNCFNYNQIGGKHSWLNNAILTVVNLLPIIIMLIIQYGTYMTAKYMPFYGNNYPMNVAQLWAFLVMIPGAMIVNRLLYKVTKNPYLAGIIAGVLISIISCANTTCVTI